tara:strand:- start:96 stop:764 length:669 start_codon:yes stop_codon:yes gene_type:complete
MCGRFVFHSSSKTIEEALDIQCPSKLKPQYNIAPSQYIAAIRKDNKKNRELIFLRWGLIPSWANNSAIGQHMFNARVETILEKPSFRQAFKQRRCVILANGFYEWSRKENSKIAYYISSANCQPFALAGIWESWKDSKTNLFIQTTAILTTSANNFMSKLHHRMPIIIELNAVNDWLHGDNNFLKNALSRNPKLQAWEVNNDVNNARNQGNYLIDPIRKFIS